MHRDSRVCAIPMHFHLLPMTSATISASGFMNLRYPDALSSCSTPNANEIMLFKKLERVENKYILCRKRRITERLQSVTKSSISFLDITTHEGRLYAVPVRQVRDLPASKWVRTCGFIARSVISSCVIKYFYLQSSRMWVGCEQ